MEPCYQLIELAQISVRGLLMLLVSIGGFLSIYLGWRLYMNAIISSVSGELDTGKIKIRFAAAGPGIILAAFGAWLLTSVAQHRFVVSHEKEKAVTYRDEYSLKAFPQKTNNTLTQKSPNETEKATYIKATVLSEGKESTPIPKCQCLVYQKRAYSYSSGGSEIREGSIKDGIEIAIREIRDSPIGSEKIMSDRGKALAILLHIKSALDDPK